MRADRPFASLIAPRRFHEFIGSCPICFEPIHEAADLRFFAPLRWITFNENRFSSDTQGGEREKEGGGGEIDPPGK